MTSKDRRYGGVFLQGNTDQPRQPWVRVTASAVCHTGSQAPHNFVKSRHAFYVVTADNLFAGGEGVHPASIVQYLR